MAMVNMGTYTTVNGVQEYTVTNKLAANGSATDESILIYSTGTVQVSPAATIAIDFLRCNLFIKDPIPASQWFNIQDASISYNADSGDRYSTASQINFEDCQVVFNGSSISAVFLSNCINTRVYNAGATMLTYTQAGANLNDMVLENSNWEVNGQPLEAANIKLVNSQITNFLVPRLDFSYIDLTTGGNNLNINTGNGGNNAVYMWNFVQFDSTKIQPFSLNNQYFDGVSASWLFQDRDLGTPVEDVLLINSSDKSGSMTELGRFTTNSSGVLTGTYDSRFETTGANQVRDTLFLFDTYMDTSGSTYPAGVGYDLISVVNQIEIRSYLHDAPVGYVVGDTYTAGEQGSIASDYAADVPLVFTMNNDLNITEQNDATVLAYTDLGTIEKLYDRHKAEWRDNDNYALISKVGSQLDLAAINLTIDATAVSVYTANTTSITAKAATYTGGATSTTGSVTTKNSTTLSGGTFDCNINYQSGAGTTITGITHTGTFDFDTAGTYTIDGCSLDVVTNSSGGAVTLLQANASTANTITGPNITVIQNVDVTNINLINLTRVQLYNVTKDAELDNSTVSGGGGYSFTVDLISAAVDDGDTLRIRGTQIDGVTAQQEYEESGIISATGLSFIGSQVADTAYAAWGLDGSTITKFTADYIGDQIDIVVAANFQLSELGAWWSYNLTTSQGIRDFYGGMTYVDEANILIHNAIVDIFMDNATTTNVHQTDNRRLYRDDLARPVEDPTSGGGGVDIEWRSPVTIANSDVIQTDLTNIYTDTQRVDGLIEDVGGDRYTSKALEESPAGGAGTTPQAVWEYATRGLTEEVTTDAASRTASQADVSGLSTFDPVTDAVANVTTVQTTVSNTDMRGTDGANTVTPPTVAQIDTELTSSHGSGSWQTGAGGTTPADVWTYATRGLTEEVTTDTASRDASKADVSDLGTKDNQAVINDGVKKSSLLIPHSDNLPDT